VTQKTWGELTVDELYGVLKLRTDVYFVEQRIDEEELDNRDQDAVHLWIDDEHGPAAYLRVLEYPEPGYLDAVLSFGRVTVRADRRGEGLAQRLIDEVIRQWGDRAMFLHAQLYVTSLYERYGFAVVGESYVEAGLPHVPMYRAAARLE
jgi:ElaA protein